MLIQIGAGIVAAGGLFALIVATRPAEFRVARTTTSPRRPRSSSPTSTTCTAGATGRHTRGSTPR
jgi:hypothetical protein